MGKRRAFEELTQKRDRDTHDRYRTQKVVVKRAVKVEKEWRTDDGKSDWRMISRVTQKMFWNEEKRVRKGEQARDEMVKDVNGQILRDGVEVRKRWAKYFDQVLNMADVREANINVVGNWRMPVLGDLKERAISLAEGRL